MSEQILSIENLTKHHVEGQLSGITNVNFKINSGEIVAIIGESGSGKSTLLKSIYGLLPIDFGVVYFEGQRVKGPDEQLIPGHPQMKMVTQDFALNIYANVYDNIASMLSNTNIALKQQKTEEMMEQLRIGHLRHKKAVTLSGGEQQRVAIARALIGDTKVLLLDEPFSQVDSVLKSELRADIKRLAEETGLTIIMVSHDANDGLMLANNIVILRNGELLEQGNPKSLYRFPNHAYTARLLGNAVVLDKYQAEKIGINSIKAQVCFYPEWIKLEQSEYLENSFIVKEVFFKGLYEELLLERNGVEIRAVQHYPLYEKNDRVNAKPNRFLEF